jgi:hypothetical protein
MFAVPVLRSLRGNLHCRLAVRLLAGCTCIIDILAVLPVHSTRTGVVTLLFGALVDISMCSFQDVKVLGIRWFVPSQAIQDVKTRALGGSSPPWHFKLLKSRALGGPSPPWHFKMS